MPKSTGEDWMGTPEVAAILGVTQRTVYKLIDHHGLRAYKLGRVIRLKREDVEAFLEAHQIKPGDLRYLYPPGEGEDKDES